MDVKQRFATQQTLGKGAQGTVYLAEDRELGRLVALKHLARRSALDEARAASRLQHPNVVTLFDAYSDESGTWMVFEFVDGRPLTDDIGRIMPVAAVTLMLGVLDGLAYSHAQGLVHRDIKPANILIDERGRARIMDFGIAAELGSKPDFGGTAKYLAPELLAGGVAGAGVDLFACGVTLYQLLTGRTPVEGDNIYSILHQLAHSEFVAPSQLNANIDERLEHIIKVALLKDPEERYSSANQMRDALDGWLGKIEQQVAGADSATGNGTLDFLIRRMRHSADFPALSQAIQAISRASNDETERLQNLSDVIVKDFALTHKLLRIVNSASYGQFGGSVSTISRAIAILGFDTIRNLAMTLLLFEHMHNQVHAHNLREQALRAFFSGLLCNHIGQHQGIKDGEEALICGMFRQLGKLLTLYYLHEEAQEIDKRAQSGLDEELAASAVLGLSLSDLGEGVARFWTLPDRLIQSMRPLGDALRTPQNTGDRLRLYANLASLLQHVVGKPPAEGKAYAQQLSKLYGKVMTINADQMLEIVAETSEQFLSYLALMGFDAGNSAFIRSLRQLSGDAEVPEPTGDALSDVVMGESAPQVSAAAIMSAGVQDITQALVGEFKLNDVLRMILETMYRAVGFDHVLFATRDAKQPLIQGRFGFGEQAQELSQALAISLGDTSDVFQVALKRNADVLIADIDADAISARIPAWYRQHFRARTFIVLPLVLGDKLIGCFYGDRAVAGSLRIAGEELNLLKTLRNQALLAIRTKQLG
ncbi:protein kinase domain-containing protein [Chitinibacteraceae bacterium HSL-7]